MNNPENNAPEEFDLFGTPADDNLKEVLAHRSYKWANKTTVALGVALLIASSASVGAWYGHRTSSSNSGAASFAAFSSRLAGLGGGGANLPSGGFGGGGGRGVSGTVNSVSGDKVTITIDNRGSSSLANAKTGDSVTVRASGNGNGVATPIVAPSPSASDKAKSPTKKSSQGGSPTATARPTLSSGTQRPFAGGGAGGPGGGPGFNNPEFTACLKANGVTITAGARPDRNDPKFAAALQACVAKLGGGMPGGGAPTGAPNSNP